jgi:hypothetical protein
MQTIDPALVNVIVAIAAAVLMVHAGLAKKQLAWRVRPVSRRRRRRP